MKKKQPNFKPALFLNNWNIISFFILGTHLLLRIYLKQIFNAFLMFDLDLTNPYVLDFQTLYSQQISEQDKEIRMSLLFSLILICFYCFFVYLYATFCKRFNNFFNIQNINVLSHITYYLLIFFLIFLQQGNRIDNLLSAGIILIKIYISTRHIIKIMFSCIISLRSISGLQFFYSVQLITSVQVLKHIFSALYYQQISFPLYLTAHVFKLIISAVPGPSHTNFFILIQLMIISSLIVDNATVSLNLLIFSNILELFQDIPKTLSWESEVRHLHTNKLFRITFTFLAFVFIVIRRIIRFIVPFHPYVLSFIQLSRRSIMNYFKLDKLEIAIKQKEN